MNKSERQKTDFAIRDVEYENTLATCDLENFTF